MQAVGGTAGGGSGGGGGAGTGGRGGVAGVAGGARCKLRRRRARRGAWRRRGQQRRAAAELAPYNSNQFLMEEHMPEPRPPRTRDSSFSVDSEDNYFFPLPEDEEDFISKEFSSVYEDAQSERLASLSKPDLLQEYLLLQAKYEAVSKRLAAQPVSVSPPPEALLRLKQQDELIQELRADNQALKLQLEQTGRPQTRSSTSNVDSESDSSSSTDGSGSTLSPVVNGTARSPHLVNGFSDRDVPMVNGNGDRVYSPSGGND